MKKLKSAGLALLFFTSFFILSFFLVFAIIGCLKNFIEITNTVFLWCSLAISIFISVVCTICIEINIHRFKDSKFSFWIGKNYPKLLLAYVLLIYALISVQNQINWTTEEVRDAISLQWTIFGLSLAVFLVWNGIIVDFLKQKQPLVTGEKTGIKKYELIKKKKSFSAEVETTFSSVILLTINMFLLIFSTSLVYIQNLSENIFAQNVVLCSFNFSIGTITILFLDILKPVKKDKAELLRNNEVTKDEWDHAQGYAFVQTYLDVVKETIMSSDKYTAEEKEAQFRLYCDALKEAVSKKENDLD